MLFNVMLEQYTQSTNLPESEAFAFLIENRKAIVNDLGRAVFKEMLLNYRTYFKTQNNDKIVDAYKQLIMTKTSVHTSDIAIGYNIVAYVNIDEQAETIIIDYMYNRLQAELPKLNKLTHKLKKHFVMKYIETNILTKKRI